MDEETPHLWPGRTSSAFYLRLSFGFGAAGSGKVQYSRRVGGSGYVVALRLRSGRIIKSTLRTSGGVCPGMTDTCCPPSLIIWVILPISTCATVILLRK